MITTHKQDMELSELVFGKVFENMKPPLLNADFVVEWVADNFSPSEVFPDRELRDWAFANGFTEEE